ncbi:MAG: flagellar biosynthesis repressor FlbT [Rhodobacterales bacterium]|nr:flagellar biosynthesis repressor FlbT [Rhodobacterales bacterium]MDX5390042.1 flagellar biosynthesis repressor FlbT [Rhodobacterales bacterium]MDX5489733.1 flagellar biosynthesis repressor FlbT [Rhodobacterales bacterium]
MALKLTLKPDERIIVNGCAIRNSGRRHMLTIESQADVIRGQDLLDPEGVATPVRLVYFLIQTALTRADLRDDLVSPIQKQLAELATVFGGGNLALVFEAANFVSIGDYYKALRALRPVMRHEEDLFARMQAKAAEGMAPPPPAPVLPDVSALMASVMRS